MTEPTVNDVDIKGKTAVNLLLSQDKNQSDSVWRFASLEDVKKTWIPLDIRWKI